MIRPRFVLELGRSMIRIARAQGRLVPLPGENVEQLEIEAFRKLQSLAPRPARSDPEESLRPVMQETEVGGRRRSVPVHPVRGVTSANQTTVRWELSPEGSRLTVFPRVVLQLVGVAVLAMGLAAAGVGVHLLSDSLRRLASSHGNLAFHSFFDALWALVSLQTIFGGLLFLSVGSLFALVGLLFVILNPPVVVFDSVEQMFWLGKRKGNQSRPFSDLLGIQVIQGNNKNREQGDVRYQLNLLLDDPARPRFNLCDHSNLRMIEELAERITEITGKPVLRQLPDPLITQGIS